MGAILRPSKRASSIVMSSKNEPSILKLRRGRLREPQDVKHQLLFLNSLDTIEIVRTLVVFLVDEHNTRCRTQYSTARRPTRCTRHSGAPDRRVGRRTSEGPRTAPGREPERVIRSLRPGARLRCPRRFLRDHSLAKLRTHCSKRLRAQQRRTSGLRTRWQTRRAAYDCL